MVFKLVVVIVIVAMARAAVIPVAISTNLVDSKSDPNPQYSFGYDVQDALTGDNKNHVETRKGDIVQGQYSLIEPDGTRRFVDYTADPVNGFNAVVKKVPLVAKIIATPARNVAPAPVVTKVLAPVVPKYASEPIIAKYAITPDTPEPLVPAQPVVARYAYPSATQIAYSSSYINPYQYVL